MNRLSITKIVCVLGSLLAASNASAFLSASSTVSIEPNAYVASTTTGQSAYGALAVGYVSLNVTTELYEQGVNVEIESDGTFITSTAVKTLSVTVKHWTPTQGCQYCAEGVTFLENVLLLPDLTNETTPDCDTTPRTDGGS